MTEKRKMSKRQELAKRKKELAAQAKRLYDQYKANQKKGKKK